MTAFPINPIQLLLAAALFLGSASAYSSDFWAKPTPVPPEAIRLAETWTQANR